MPSHDIANANKSSRATPANSSGNPVWTRPADGQTGEHQHDQDAAVVDQIGDGATGQHGRAGHRQRAEAVDDALVDVVGHADRGRGRREDDGLGKDARHQELAVGVGAVARDRDGAAEDEREQQHEHDRLEDREDRQLGDARDPLAGCARRRAGRPRPPDGCRRWRLAIRSVAVRGRRSAATLPSVGFGGVAGEGEEDVVQGRTAQADVVDGDVGLVEVAHDLDERCAPPCAGTVSRRVCSSTVGARRRVAGQDLDRPAAWPRGRGRRPRSARHRPATSARRRCPGR